MSESTVESIAIIGVHGRFPGAESVEAFWEHLVAGRETLSFFSDDELRESGLDPEALRREGKYVAARGMLKDVEWFDASFFGVNPKEAEVMDPQHRLFLEGCWEALERAGYAPGRISGSVGVFAGASQNTYYIRNLHDRPELRELVGPEQIMLGNEKDYIATRVAYKLDLTGPAITLNTACSSSLVAICQACQALLTYQCDLAIGGGISITTPQKRGYFHQEGNIGSADGHTRSFDAAASGTAFSNGLSLIVMKRLSDAIADRDTIYAVIKGAAINNDGSQRVSFGAPGVQGQSEVIALAQAIAGIEPDSIGYVEAHGTATPMGDPIEVAALTKAFRQGTDRKGYCALGSVKTNVGHLDAAAGGAGLIKTALALKNKLIPASLHFKAPNPKLDLENSPFFVNASLRTWETVGDQPRRAGVSSFGTGGTNAHVIVEEAPELRSSGPSRPLPLILLSAKTPAALDQATRRLVEHFRKHPDFNLSDAEYTLQVGRTEMAHRRMLVCTDVSDAAAALEQGDAKRVLSARQELRRPPVVFMFPGQGAQSLRMGEQVYAHEPVFREEVDRCCRFLTPILGTDLRQVLYPAAGSDTTVSSQVLTQTRFAQPSLFVVEYALAKLWMSWGVMPSAMIGHSVGEYVAGCLAGVFSLEDALTVVARRAALVQAQPPGVMMAVRMAESDLLPLLKSPVCIAAVNSPNLCVVSGPDQAVAELHAELEARGIAGRRLATSHAFHSSMMDGVVAPFTEVLRGIKLSPPKIPYVSNVTARWITPEEAMSPEYWAGHVRQTVRFAEGVAELAKDPRRVLVEVGPGQTLSQLARQHPDRQETQPVLSSLAGVSDDEYRSLITTLGRLWLSDVEIDWEAYHQDRLRHRVVLPTYAFERKRFWPEGPVRVAAPAALTTPVPTPVVCGEGRPSATVTVESTLEQEIDTPAVVSSRRDQLLAQSRSILEDLSGMRLQEVDPSVNFLELGLDSLLLTQAAQLFQKRFGVSVSFQQVMEELSSLESLVIYLDERMPQTGTPKAAGKASHPASNGVRPTTTSSATAVVSATPEKAFGPFRGIDKNRNAGALTDRQQEFLRVLIGRYTAKTPKSKEHTQRHRKHLADPRTVAGFRPYWKEMVYPLVVERSSGSRMWDIDGREYIDFTMGFGTNLLGHSPAFVTEALQAQLRRGVEVGPQTPLAGKVAELMCELSGMERCAFCNTGSEGVLAAIRISRTVTGRNKIVYFGGDYHGIFDEVLQRAAGSPPNQRLIPIAPGIPPASTDNVLILDYNQPQSLEIIRSMGDEIAAVIVEAVQSRAPDLQPIDFLVELRKVTHEIGCALVFDEVITGFRVHPGGVQGLFGIRADIATYGKLIGGGMPIGAICGTARFMDALDGGFWSYGDTSIPEAGVTFFAGTYVRHPLAITAAHALLSHLKAEGPLLQHRLNVKMAAIVDELNAFLAANRMPLRLEHFASLFWVRFELTVKYSSLFFFMLRDKGIHIFEGRLFFLSTAHSDADIVTFLKAFKDTMLELREAGFLPQHDHPMQAQPSRRVFPGTPSSDDALVRSVGVGSNGNMSDAAPANVSVSSSGARPKELPLTEAQQGLWLLSKMVAEGNRAYAECTTLKLSGPLDVECLRKALQGLVDRHEGLRARIDANGQRQNLINDANVSLPVVDLSGLSKSEQEQRLQKEFREIEQGDWDFSQLPSLRVRLFRLGLEEHLLVLRGHHVFGNGPSNGVLFEDLAALYAALAEGRLPTLEPAMQLGDYVMWREAQMKTAEFERDMKFWRDQFADSVPTLDLPSDRPRPSRISCRGGVATVHVNPEVTAGLRKLNGKLRSSMFMILFAGFNACLHRISGQDDLVVGVPFEGPARSLPGGQFLYANTTNVLPLRSKLTVGMTMAEMVAATKSLVLAASQHQHCFFGRLIPDLKIKADPSRFPLVAVSFNYERDVFKKQMGPIAAELLLDDVPFAGPSDTSNFELTVNIVDLGDRLRIDCHFISDLYDLETVRRWMGNYAVLLEGMVADSTLPLLKLPILTAQERTRVLQEFNRTEIRVEEGPTVHAMFETQAARTPESIALLCGSKECSYRELAERSDRLSVELVRLGVSAGTLVGLHCERSIDMVLGLLGILKAGGAYVPLDPAFPQERLSMMVEDAAMPVILSQRSIVNTLPKSNARLVHLDDPITASASSSGKSNPTKIGAEDLAYVLFTSGSTGRPKGVQIPHGAMVNFLVSMRREPGLRSSDVLLAVTTLSFDIAGLELFLPLVTGAKVVIVPKDIASDALRLIELMGTVQPTVMQATPATWRMLVEAGWKGDSKLKILCGGEAINSALAELLHPRCAELWNMYGPTETTVWSTLERLKPGQRITVGRPIANTQVYVLDALQQPVPLGSVGELYIGGDGVARGYLKREDLTRERFLQDPFQQAGSSATRMYRTGDLARFLPDGRVDLLGRADHQVKIRGFRIELGDIESALLKQPGVLQAVVVARESSSGAKLAAYLVPDVSVGAPPSVPDLRTGLRKLIPEYMVPSSFTILEKLPLTPNGKVDRKALPAGDVEAQRSDSPLDPPRGAVEQKLAEIWSRLLDLPQVGRHDGFFDVGGHSIVAVKLAVEVEKEFGVKLPLADLLTADTIAKLAPRLAYTGEIQKGYRSLVAVQPRGDGPPFFCVHGAGGNILLYRALAKRLGDSIPFYGIQSRGLDEVSEPHNTIEEMAEAYLDEMVAKQPSGPYFLGGYCMGGLVAFEMARQLLARGERVAFVALLDSYNPQVVADDALKASRIGYVKELAGFHWKNLASLPISGRVQYLKEKARMAVEAFQARMSKGLAKRPRTGGASQQTLQEINDAAGNVYQPLECDAPITVFKPSNNYSLFNDPSLGWREVCSGKLEIVELPMNPHAMLVEPYVQKLAVELKRCLEAARATAEMSSSGAQSQASLAPKGRG